MKRRTLFTTGLVVLVILGILKPALAIDSITKEVPVTLDSEVTKFCVTVPTVLPIDVDTLGNITVATDAKIINNSTGPIKISRIRIIPNDTWKLVEYDKEFKGEKLGGW